MAYRAWVRRSEFRFLAFVAFITCILISEGAEAEDLLSVQQTLRKSLVYLELNAQTKNGVPLQSRSTGFIFDGRGRILTTYHLISEIEKKAASSNSGELIAASINITAHIGNKGAQSFPAEIVSRNQDRDVLVLSIPSSGNGDYPIVCISTARSSRLKERVVTAGFPDALPYITGLGSVIGEDGPNGTWITDAVFNPGQSGSPVLTEKGEVIGIAKGQMVDTAGEPLPGAYVVIPITDAQSVASTMSTCSSGQAGNVIAAQLPLISCTNEALGRLNRREEFKVTGGARASGPGPSTNVVREQNKVCFNAPPNSTIVGQVQVRDLGNDGGRGKISPVEYLPQVATRPTIACVIVDAWSDPGPFGAGGWQNVELGGQVQYAPTEEDRQRIKEQCQSGLLPQ